MKKLFFISFFLLFASLARGNVTCDYCVFYDGGAGGDSGTCTSSPAWDDPYHSVMRTWAAGDIVCVADDHVESSASLLTMEGPVGEGTNDFPIVLCVDRSTCTGSGVCEVCDQPSERASVSTTSTGDIVIKRKLWIYGIDFTSADDLNVGGTGGDPRIHLEQSELTMTGAGFDNFYIGVSSAGSEVALVDVDMTFAATGQGITLKGGFSSWDGGSLTNNATNLIEAIAAFSQTWFTVRNVDLSVLSGNIVYASQAQSSFDISFERCKFHASTTPINGTLDVPAQVLNTSFCHSGSVIDPLWQKAEFHYQGEINASALNVMSGGISKSWEFDTNGSNFQFGADALCSKEKIGAYVSGGSSLTLAVHFNGAASLSINDIWADWTLTSESADSLGIRRTSRGLPGDTTALTAGGESWTSGTSYKATTTFTPAEDGIVEAQLCVATLTSSTKVYLNPAIIVE